jgi:catechol 1,2-dioxygenase
MEDTRRLEAIWLRTVDALKDIVREFRITQDELHAAGDYFNRLGTSGMCRSLLDVALAMTSVEANGGTEVGTRPCLEGPYHRPHPQRLDQRLFEGPAPAGMPRLVLTGQVRDARDGAPIADAWLDFWQADSNGIYDRAGNHLRGKVLTDDQGCYRIETVLPNDYAEHDHDPIGELFRAMGKHNTRAAHIHLKAGTGAECLLTTQLFMPTSSFLATDYVEGAVHEELIVTLEEDGEGGYVGTFDVALAKTGVSA